MRDITRSFVYCARRLYAIPLIVGLLTFALFFPPWTGSDMHPQSFWIRLVILMLISYILLVLTFGCSPNCKRSISGKPIGVRLGGPKAPVLPKNGPEHQQTDGRMIGRTMGHL